MSAASPQPAYRIEDGALPDHENLLIRLWHQSGLSTAANEQADFARLNWFYRENPQGRAQINFLLFGGSRDLVGCLGVAPRQFFVAGIQMLGGTLVDFCVDPKHRSAYPALTLQRAGRERALQALEFVYGLPDTKAVAVCKRLTTHVSFQLPRFVRVIRSRAYLARVLPAILAAALARIVDGVDFLVTQIRLFSSQNVGAWTTEFDERFDSLWQAFEKTLRCVGARDRVFLRWRFGAQPQHTYRIFTITKRNSDELRMYFVCELSEHVLTVKDCLNVGSQRELAHGLLLLVIAARKFGVNAVDLQISADNIWCDALRAANFSMRSQRLFFAAFREPLQQKAEGCEWYITQADEDI